MTDPSAPPPLGAAEEAAWRTLVRLLVILPRAVDEDLERRSGMTLTRYVVLMRLSETPGHALRMSDLARAVSLSPSRMTRVAQSLMADGLICREASEEDSRAFLARLTPAGWTALRAAWPAHLAGVRSLVLDHIDPGDLPEFHRITARLLLAL